METNNMIYVYYGLICISFGVSLPSLRRLDKNIFITALLFISIVVELCVVGLINLQLGHYFLYHLFTPIEHSLLSLFFFYSTDTRPLKVFILFSILVFNLFSIYSMYMFGVSQFPSLTNTVESFLLIITSLIFLMTIKPIESTKIYYLLEFWVALAVLIYFTGTFVFNGIYNYLRIDSQIEAKVIFDVLNSVFNWIFYVLLSYGFLCLYRRKSSS